MFEKVCFCWFQADVKTSSSTLLEKICLPPPVVFTGSESVSYCRQKICSPFVISDVKVSIVIFGRFLRYS
jgi:hypothetical protein